MALRKGLPLCVSVSLCLRWSLISVGLGFFLSPRDRHPFSLLSSPDLICCGPERKGSRKARIAVFDPVSHIFPLLALLFCCVTLSSLLSFSWSQLPLCRLRGCWAMLADVYLAIIVPDLRYPHLRGESHSSGALTDSPEAGWTGPWALGSL